MKKAEKKLKAQKEKYNFSFSLDGMIRCMR